MKFISDFALNFVHVNNQKHHSENYRLIHEQLSSKNFFLE